MGITYRGAKIVAATGMLGVVSVAGADVILNPDFVVTSTATTAAARYRMSNTNWDTFIGTSSVVSVATTVQNANIGNDVSLNNVSMTFGLTYTAGSGYRWAISNGVTTSTMSWQAIHTDGSSPTTAFNAISLSLIAGTSMPGGVTAASASARNLTFSFVGGGPSVTGSLRDLTSSWSAGVSTGLDRIVIFSDTNLANNSWTLTGNVLMSYTGTPSGSLDERLKFDVNTMAAIPQPASLAAFGLVAVLSQRRTRR
jgi:hypothetical protein